MTFADRIRNFFYAATHANELMAEKDRLSNQVFSLEVKCAALEDKAQKDMASYRLSMQNAMNTVLPDNPTGAELKALYFSVSQLDPAGATRLRESLIMSEQFEFLRCYSKSYAEFARIHYTNTLVELGVLPKEWRIRQVNEDTLQVIREEMGADQLPSKMPVSQISYLDTHGMPKETVVYHDAAAFLQQAMQSNYCGEPMAITVFKDTASDKHIDTTWIESLDPPPQGFQIVPYDPVKELTVQFTREELASELELRKREYDAGEDLGYRRPTVPEYYATEDIQQALDLLESTDEERHGSMETIEKIPRLDYELEM